MIAYHGIGDEQRFAAQLEELARRYRPVGAPEVVAALRSGRRLPRRAVWVTFDDGRPELFDAGRALLDRYAVPATVFVCPSLVGGTRPPWWVTAAAGSLDVDGAVLRGVAVVTPLKRVPDAERRAALERLRFDGDPPTEHQPDVDELRAWMGDGHTVGNHTWDHPCLDRCPPDAQRQQIEDGHRWLQRELGIDRPLFAYPNGDWTASAEAVLEDLGIDLACLFDHRLVARRPNPLRVSRLRLDADAPIERFRAVVSGAHPILYGIGARATERSSSRRPPAAASVE